jgi:hypothetical protein
MIRIVIASAALAFGALIGAPQAHADWHCQLAYMGGETFCNDDTGRTVGCFNWGQMTGKCLDAATGAEVPRPPGA